MTKIEKIKEDILDWRDKQLMSITKWLNSIVTKRLEEKKLKDPFEKAKKGFRDIAKVNMSHITVEEKLMNESYINQPCDSLTKEQRAEWKMHNVIKTKNKL